MNVLIYSGDGASVDSVRQTKGFLTRLLSPYYAVSVISTQQLLEEPWMAYTALLVIPGGADLPYCRDLNGSGNQRIKQYVRKGGKYLGLCAGGYFGAREIEFEKGTNMEVSGPRELAFYEGCAKGTVFKGFKYGSDEGAHAATVSYVCDGLTLTTATYYNGGCMFDGDKNAEVLARYVGPVDIKVENTNPAAIVFKQYGEGKVLLSGVHFEYDLDEKAIHHRDIPLHVVARIYEAHQTRKKLTEFLLHRKLGLRVHVGDDKVVPRLTPIHLTSSPGKIPSVSHFMESLSSNIDEDGVFEDSEDTLRFVRPNDGTSKFTELLKTGNDNVKIIFVHDKLYPTSQETPFFNHSAYFSELSSYIDSHSPLDGSKLGALLAYGEVVASTNIFLEKNKKLLRNAPHGLIAVGTQQTAGRGRGSNVWVNPVGVMAVSGVIRIPQNQCHQSLVFIQYLTSLAVIRAIKSFLPKGEDIGLRLKWPNDVYIKLDDQDRKDSYAKIGGVTVSCNVFNGDFVVVFGSGTNIDNQYPTVSVNSRISQLNAGEQIHIEKLLARFMTILDVMVQNYLVTGFKAFEEDYASVWMHTGAKVTLERYGNVQAVVKGISSDTGMLIAEDISGINYELQPDGNSFDMLRGLIRRKTE